jgi:hypothetical protein
MDGNGSRCFDYHKNSDSWFAHKDPSRVDEATYCRRLAKMQYCCKFPQLVAEELYNQGDRYTTHSDIDDPLFAAIVCGNTLIVIDLML